MRDLDPLGAELQRQRHHLGDMIDVGAMHHGIDGERNAVPRHLGGQRFLALVRALVARDVVGRARLVVLNRDLHVVEPGIGQLREGLLGDADGRCDEVGVEPGVMRGPA